MVEHRRYWVGPAPIIDPEDPLEASRLYRDFLNGTVLPSRRYGISPGYWMNVAPDGTEYPDPPETDPPDEAA